MHAPRPVPRCFFEAVSTRPEKQNGGGNLAPLRLVAAFRFEGRHILCRATTLLIPSLSFFCLLSMFLLFLAGGVHACPPSACLLALLTHTRHALQLLLPLAHQPTPFLPFFLLLRSVFPRRLLLLLLPLSSGRSHCQSRLLPPPSFSLPHIKMSWPSHPQSPSLLTPSWPARNEWS